MVAFDPTGPGVLRLVNAQYDEASGVWSPSDRAKAVFALAVDEDGALSMQMAPAGGMVWTTLWTLSPDGQLKKPK